VKDFWEQTKGLTGVEIPFLHPATWARDLMISGIAKDRAVILCGMWALRTLRNKRRHGEPAWPVEKAVLWVRDTAYDLWELVHPVKKAEKATAKLCWERPSARWVKCNVDAAIFAESGQGGTGVVLRDETGMFLGAQATPYAHCMDATTVEAWACWDAMELARRCRAAKLCVETDCMELVRLWQSREMQRSVITPVLKEMQDLSLDFSEFSLVFASRLCNRVAHEIARQASGMPEMVEWHDDPPSSIQGLLDADCNPMK
jgi:ribonuclease HI